MLHVVSTFYSCAAATLKTIMHIHTWMCIFSCLHILIVQQSLLHVIQKIQTPVSPSLPLLSVSPSDKGERGVGSLRTPQFNFQNPSVPASHLESAAGERGGGWREGGGVGTARNTPLMGCFCYRPKIRREEEYGTFTFFFLSWIWVSLVDAFRKAFLRSFQPSRGHLAQHDSC